MTVRKKKKGWMVDFYFTFPDGTKERIRKSAPGRTKPEAEAYEKFLLRELIIPTPPKKKEVPPTLRNFSDEFMELHVLPNSKASTIKDRRMIFKRHLLPALGLLALDEIDTRKIDGYKSKNKKSGLSKKTINNHLAVLSRCLTKAKEWKIIDSVPKIHWFKVPKTDFDFFDFEEADRLLSAANATAEPEWYTMIMLALRTGVRQNEILGLRWDDVDLKRGQIQINQGNWRGHIDTPKGGRSRSIPLSPQCLDTLKKHRHLRGEFVFCQEDGRPHTDGQCKWPLWSACRNAGLRRIGWHVLRHTFASHLVMRGVSLKAVQELLGHTTIEMTMRYAHLSPEVTREAVTSLDGGTLGHQLGIDSKKMSTASATDCNDREK